MGFRIMLVSFVASMGLEMPSDQDFTSWKQQGQAWVKARASELSGLRAEAARQLAEATGCEREDEPSEAPAPVVAEAANARADLAFEAATEVMASDFAADLLAMKAEPVPQAPVLAEVEPSTPAITAPEGEESGCVVAQQPQPTEVAPVVVAGEEPAEKVAVTEETPSRSDRLSSAVRLTREAVQAWAGLLQEPAEDTGLSQ